MTHEEHVISAEITIKGEKGGDDYQMIHLDRAEGDEYTIGDSIFKNSDLKDFYKGAKEIPQNTIKSVVFTLDVQDITVKTTVAHGGIPLETNLKKLIQLYGHEFQGATVQYNIPPPLPTKEHKLLVVANQVAKERETEMLLLKSQPPPPKEKKVTGETKLDELPAYLKVMLLEQLNSNEDVSGDDLVDELEGLRIKVRDVHVDDGKLSALRNSNITYSKVDEILVEEIERHRKGERREFIDIPDKKDGSYELIRWLYVRHVELPKMREQIAIGIRMCQLADRVSDYELRHYRFEVSSRLSEINHEHEKAPKEPSTAAAAVLPSVNDGDTKEKEKPQNLSDLIKEYIKGNNKAFTKRTQKIHDSTLMDNWDLIYKLLVEMERSGGLIRSITPEETSARTALNRVFTELADRHQGALPGYFVNWWTAVPSGSTDNRTRREYARDSLNSLRQATTPE